MKKKMYLAAAGLVLGGCLLGIGLGGTAAAVRGNQGGGQLAATAEETVCESSETLSERELKKREKERREETEESFQIYEEFGLTYDKEQNRFFYNGKLVRHFNDQIGESSNAFHHDEGVIDVIPIRDEKGELTGLRQASDEEFDERTKQQEALRRQFPADPEENSCMEIGELDAGAYAVYEPFGLTCEKDSLIFEGKRVRCFLDGVEIAEGGMAVRRMYLDEKGTVDVHTVRTVIDNGDGSYDPFGDIVRLEKYSEEEFAGRDLQNICGSLEAETTDVSAEDGGFWSRLFGKRNKGETFADRFEKYGDFGIIYTEAAGGSGVGNVYYNDELVRSFVDQNPEGGVFSFHSFEEGEIDVRTVYDSKGRLSGVEKAERDVG